MEPRSRHKLPTIKIDGKAIELTPDLVDIDDVQLDADNPRIRYLVQAHGLVNPTQAQLKDLLWQVGGVQDLMRRIRDNRGSIDPILVTEHGVVIEGNCRLACYRHLRPQGKDWQTIEAYRLPKISQREIDILLSKYHVSGKINWRSYAQAGQIYKLQRDHHMSVKEITRVTGINEKTVKDLLKTYEIMTARILPELPGAQGLKKFSYVYEFVKHPELAEWRSDDKNIKEFSTWVTEGKLKKGADVRELPKVLKDKAALKAMRQEKDAKKAIRMVVRPKEFETLEDAARVLGDLKPDLIQRLTADKTEQKVIKTLFEKLRGVAEMAELDLE